VRALTFGKYMKVSIITAAFNDVEYIGDCIGSVMSQDYHDIEYIVVDGGSTDGTIDAIKKYENGIDVWVSEPDNGVYDALNKGIRRATGDIIGFLHADDVYADNSVIRKVVDNIVRTRSQSCYGDLLYVKRGDPSKTVRYWRSCDYVATLFSGGWMPPHPSFFVQRGAYELHGMFDLRLGSAADYELMLRFLKVCKITTSYIPEVLVKMRTGGISNISIKNRLRANRMDRLAWKVNGLRPPLLLPLRKPLSKIGQWLFTG
jgi:glycosyltransferase involved in cell wall biosynthesis